MRMRVHFASPRRGVAQRGARWPSVILPQGLVSNVLILPMSFESRSINHFGSYTPRVVIRGIQVFKAINDNSARVLRVPRIQRFHT